MFSETSSSFIHFCSFSATEMEMNVGVPISKLNTISSKVYIRGTEMLRHS